MASHPTERTIQDQTAACAAVHRGLVALAGRVPIKFGDETIGPPTVPARATDFAELHHCSGHDPRALVHNVQWAASIGRYAGADPAQMT
jgi:hypothetical protein